MHPGRPTSHPYIAPPAPPTSTCSPIPKSFKYQTPNRYHSKHFFLRNTNTTTTYKRTRTRNHNINLCPPPPPPPPPRHYPLALLRTRIKIITVYNIGRTRRSIYHHALSPITASQRTTIRSRSNPSARLAPPSQTTTRQGFGTRNSKVRSVTCSNCRINTSILTASNNRNNRNNRNSSYSNRPIRSCSHIPNRKSIGNNV